MKSSGLPPPGTAPPARVRSMMQSAILVVAWVISSNSTILANKWLITSGGFGYPILLTCWHLAFASVVTQVLARTTCLLRSRHSLPINRRFYLRTIVPIGVAASGSLVCANFAYFWLSVAFLQMIKASTPVVMLFVSWVLGVANPTLGSMSNIGIIAGGVVMASSGELQFSWIGVGFQLFGIAFEAIRVVLIQVMLSSEGMKMDPMVGLYYYAPVCAVFNLLIACYIEVPRLSLDGVTASGWLMLFLSAPIAFFLNYTSMVLIGKTSGVIMSLAGILKNILLVICSVMIWHTHITGMQYLGYSISLGGLVYYSFGYEQLASSLRNTNAWLRSQWSSLDDSKSRVLLKSSENTRYLPRISFRDPNPTIVTLQKGH